MNGTLKGLVRRRRARRGFTLVELLLVLVILATLAAIVVPKLAGRGRDAEISATKAQISTFQTALRLYEVDMGDYPDDSMGLQALIEEPQNNADRWKGYLETNVIPKDPWDNEFIYEYPGEHNPRGYDLFSMGPDGRAGTEDDIANWIEEE